MCLIFRYSYFSRHCSIFFLWSCILDTHLFYSLCLGRSHSQSKNTIENKRYSQEIPIQYATRGKYQMARWRIRLATVRRPAYTFPGGEPRMRETIASRAILMFWKEPRMWIFLSNKSLRGPNNKKERLQETYVSARMIRVRLAFSMVIRNRRSFIFPLVILLAFLPQTGQVRAPLMAFCKDNRVAA